MVFVGYLSKVPKRHICGRAMETREVIVSFNSKFPVDYCDPCGEYIYQWGADENTRIRTGNLGLLTDYIGCANEIIKEIHSRNRALCERVGREPKGTGFNVEVARAWAAREKLYPCWTKV